MTEIPYFVFAWWLLVFKDHTILETFRFPGIEPKIQFDSLAPLCLQSYK